MKQRGFTLLEVILAVVIFAASAMMVISTLPSRSGADIFGQQFASLVEYGSDRAVMDGNIMGLVITPAGFQLVRAELKNNMTRWTPLIAARIATGGAFPDDLHVSLAPQRLAATLENAPQILFLPDGEIGRFTLTLESRDKQHHFRVASQGSAPVTVENDG
ncbi:hypothetical protein Entcl_2933 [[Enterobacter] lignolyticus SCF1]|uniref:Type II secretion system protein H n=2 Tax=[Enterobacter] lignolyticus TaxID=1334193 RepID=E3G246_ENTLS|nr:hypothetical protein Entcl_2933 [[Enterobacter] lignolyticus SCF1]